MNARYKVTTWHGENRTLFYVVDTYADSQPAVIETYYKREDANGYATFLNRKDPAGVAGRNGANMVTKVFDSYSELGKLLRRLEIEKDHEARCAIADRIRTWTNILEMDVQSLLKMFEIYK